MESPIGTGAYFGSVPDTAEGTAHAASMIGQGQVLVSPFALAVAAASIGNGSLVSPVLVEQADLGRGAVGFCLPVHRGRNSR